MGIPLKDLLQAMGKTEELPINKQKPTFDEKECKRILRRIIRQFGSVDLYLTHYKDDKKGIEREINKLRKLINEAKMIINE